MLQGVPTSREGNTMSHYTAFEEILEIENGLRENLSFGEITDRVDKDRSTVSREVRKYAV